MKRLRINSDSPVKSHLIPKAFYLAACVYLGCTVSVEANAANNKKLPAEQVEFFEKEIRPVLVKRCYACHGAKKQEASLRLDSHAWMMKGSDTGAAVVPGDPLKSRIIQVIQYHDDDSQMPPSGKMPPQEIAALTRWVKMGTPWPYSENDAKAVPTNGAYDYETLSRSHWAFQPITKPAIPPIKDQQRTVSPVDHFVIAKLEEKGLSLSPAVDKRKLIRRASIDLTGLPPTYEEVEAFANNTDPQAYEKLVDRLLASPAYGERWGRHWLDVARYADTKGYVFTSERRYPYSYTYRDYVIRAFNEDLPFNQFILEQLAADQLDRKGDDRSLAALGFLTVGRRYRGNIHDITDDRIDLVSRGLLGLTASCARCHDHKFDPVPTKDYYSLYSVFVSSYEPEEKDLPLIGKPKSDKAYEKYQEERAKRQQKVDDYIHAEADKFRANARLTVGEVLQAVAEKQNLAQGDEKPQYAKEAPHRRYVDLWRAFLARSMKTQRSVFAPWSEFAGLKKQKGDFARQASELIQKLAKQEAETDPNKRINRLVIHALKNNPPESMYDVCRVYGDVFKEVEQAWLKAVADAAKAKKPAPEKLDDPAAEELRQILYHPETPTASSDAEVQNMFNRAQRNRIRQLEKELATLDVTSPGAPPRAMVMLDKDKPVTSFVHLRGNPGRRGDKVPRQFFRILAGEDRQPFQQGSGRLELAKSIASRDNPLTARVFVNRVWMHHFGEGLVRTPSDFGVRSDPPSHPELLDYLASRFMDEGWSVKSLHKLIMLSATYKQGAQENPEAILVDSDNRLLWKHVPRRLGFEAMRDSILFVSGQLSDDREGRGFVIDKMPTDPRRTVYSFIDRNNLPNVFRTFDFANVESSTAERPYTTVPQQALFAMNSPLLLEQSALLVKDLDLEKITADKGMEEAITRLYQRVLARKPEKEEIELGKQFLQHHRDQIKSPARMSGWEKYAQVLCTSNEFMFVD
ncbi:PSD1 and planctomycete cytochrome C domain-containing protein [Gimesia panareensis]|uniref:PSD1 and planctomycete cytochrome C domain-containing protein n=1 Tax=Gimesia panareensis TaxID=2527978 RepID=UPI00118C5341|nr:PSD1 and planctomycete cytochrome C domain-containing protein [Gimesia panareensis]QDU49934.1 Planctomycete cytochrome C [Gimesia panareensis]